MESRGLTQDQSEKVAELREIARKYSSRPDYLSDECLIRILVARDFKIEPAYEMWNRWVDWRVSNRIEYIRNVNWLTHIQSGEAFFHGVDKLGRPCLIIRARYHNPSQFSAENYIRYSIYLAECGSRLADAHGSGQICVIYDRAGITDSNQDPEFISSAKKLASIFQDFYAERLGAFFILHASWLHWIIFHAVKPTLPKKTRQKLHVFKGADGLQEYFDQDQLLVEYSGTDPYVHQYPAV